MPARFTGGHRPFPASSEHFSLPLPTSSLFPLRVSCPALTQPAPSRHAPSRNTRPSTGSYMMADDDEAEAGRDPEAVERVSDLLEQAAAGNGGGAGSGSDGGPDEDLTSPGKLAELLRFVFQAIRRHPTPPAAPRSRVFPNLSSCPSSLATPIPKLHVSHSLCRR